MTRPLSIIILVVLELILAFISIGGGVSLLGDVSGKTLGLQPLIPYLPFNLHDYTLVGVWLIAVYGMLPIILAAGLWLRKKWAWKTALGLGAVLIFWIVAEVFLFYSLGFTYFYPLIGGIGLITVILLYLPSTRDSFRGLDSLTLGSNCIKNEELEGETHSNSEDNIFIKRY